MERETNRLLDKKHCPLFRLRLQPLINYYKLLTSMIISFQSNRITVRKFVTDPDTERGSSLNIVQDKDIDSLCFRNVCKRLGCQHCWDNFSDEEYSEAVKAVRKDNRKRNRVTSYKRCKSVEKKMGEDAKVR